MKTVILIFFVSLACLAGCSKKSAQTAVPEPAHKHEHKPPHHGTPVVLGNEEYHVELVLDPPAGKIQAYILDGELENFIRIQQPSFMVVAKLSGGEELLTFQAVANNATGETIGDTSLFEAQAEWLKTTATFDGLIKDLQVRDKSYRDVAFNFPKGNDTDEKEK